MATPLGSAGGLAPGATPAPIVRTLRIDDPGPLLSRLPREEALAWVRGGDGLVGWGVAARLEVTGEERFSRAQRWWAQWCRQAHVDDRVHTLGSGPVAFASFTFDSGAPGLPGHPGQPGQPGQPGHPGSDAATSRVIVPRFLLGRRGDLAWLTTVADGPEESPTPPVVPPVAAPAAPTALRWREGSRSAASWQDAVAAAIDRIAAGEVDKVVLARDIVAEIDGSFDVRHALERLATDYPECWTFSVDGLFGATPELLVRRSGDEIVSRVLAGTVKRRGEAAADASLASALLASGKDLEEHEYAVHSVARALATHCTDLAVPERPRVLQLANVQHLATDVRGRLADDTPVLALAASLHPTAAVCGTPTERALQLIREIEGLDRGRYAGPVGWIDARGDGEFGIALRCASIAASGTSLRAYAGCGIVAGSDPESELAESRAKLVPIRDALSGPTDPTGD